MSGEPLPDEIVNAPELWEGLEFYLQAFNDLSTERHHGMGIMEIPWSKIQQYGEIQGLDYAHIRELHYIIRRIDIAFCNWLDKQNGTGTSGPSKPGTDNPE